MKKYMFEKGEIVTFRDDMILGEEYGVVRYSNSLKECRCKRYTIQARYQTPDGNYYGVLEKVDYFSEEMFVKKIVTFKEFNANLDIIIWIAKKNK